MTALGALSAFLLVLWWLGSLGMAELDARAARRWALGGSGRPPGALRMLPPDVRHALFELTGALEDGEAVDDRLAEALVALAGARWHSGRTWAFELVGWTLAVLPLIPAASGLAALPSAWSTLGTLSPASALLVGPSAFDRALETMAAGVFECGLALGLLTLRATTARWRNGPNAREARWIRATLDRVARSARRYPLGVSTELARGLAPAPALSSTLVGFAGWTAAIGAAVFALSWSADERAGRRAPPPLSVWPSRLARLEVPPTLRLPTARGGRPLTEPAPVLELTPTAVRLGVAPLFVLNGEGALPEGWEDAIRARVDELSFSPHRLLVVADGRVPVRLVRRVLDAVLDLTSPRRVELLYRREGSGDLVSLSLVRAATAPEQGLRLDRVVNAEVRAWVRSSGDAPTLFVERSAGTWGELVQRLGSADDACPSSAPCQLPGFGASVALGR